MKIDIEQEIKQLKVCCEEFADNIDDWYPDKDYVMMEKSVTKLLDSVVFVNVWLLKDRLLTDKIKKTE